MVGDPVAQQLLWKYLDIVVYFSAKLTRHPFTLIMDILYPVKL